MRVVPIPWPRSQRMSSLPWHQKMVHFTTTFHQYRWVRQWTLPSTWSLRQRGPNNNLQCWIQPPSHKIQILQKGLIQWGKVQKRLCCQDRTIAWRYRSHVEKSLECFHCSRCSLLVRRSQASFAIIRGNWGPVFFARLYINLGRLGLSGDDHALNWYTWVSWWGGRASSCLWARDVGRFWFTA